VVRALRWALGLGLGLGLLTMAAWWYVLAQIVPNIAQWRLPLAQEISAQLGSQVQIGQMRGFSQGWRPAIEMTDIRVVDAAKREGLTLPRLTAQLSLETLWPTSLWQRRVVFHDLTLERPRVGVRRDANGQWHVAGVAMPRAQVASSSQDNAALTWLMAQHHVRVVNATVTWTDERRHVDGQVHTTSAATSLEQVDAQLRSRPGWGGRVHEWRVQATPPKNMAQRVTLSAQLRQPWWSRSATAWPWRGAFTRVGDWQTWSGQANLQLPWVDVQSLRAWWAIPAHIQGGQGALALTLNIEEGTSQALALQVNVRDVAVRLGEGLQPMAFKQLRGVIKVAHEPWRTRLSWENLTFITDEDLIWPASQASMELTYGPEYGPGQTSSARWWPQLQRQWADPALQGRLTSSRVDVALLNRLADRLPLSEPLREQMAHLSPQGIGEDLIFTWHGAMQAPVQYRLQGRLKGLSWLADASHPGLAGAALVFNASNEGGQASVDVKQGWVAFPGAFEDPRIPIDFLKAQVRWRRLAPPAPGQPAGLRVEVSEADFANADAQGSLKATWQTGSADPALRLPGSLDMTGQLSRAQGTRVWRYLPALMRQEARDYVRQAVRGGVAHDVQFQVKGPLERFPFKDNVGGLFRITASVEDVELGYAPGWPVFTQLKGRLVFEGQGLRIEQAQAKLGTVGTGLFALQNVQGQIPDLDTADPILTIEGQGSGPLNDVLGFVNTSPVGGWTGRMLDAASAEGQGKASLALVLPLLRIEQATVKGRVAFDPPDQASVRLGAGVPLLQSAQGVVQFTQDALSVQAKARVWGQPVNIQGSHDPQGVPRFEATGTLSADALRLSNDWPALSRMARYMKGQMPVTVSVALARHKSGAGAAAQVVTRPELQISSSLMGLALNLPAPFNKPASASWPLKIVHRVDSPDARTDAWLIDMAGGPLQFKADYRRDLQGPKPRVQKGLLQLIQGPAPAWPAAPATGVTARLSVPVLDVQAWEPVVAMLSGAGVNDTDPDEFMPTQVQFKTNALTWQQRTLRDVNMHLSRPAPEVWRAKVTALQLAGDVELRPDAPPKPGMTSPGRRVVAHFTRLSVPDAEARLLDDDQTVRQVLQTSVATVPALDITIDQFEWRGLPLGKLEVQATNRLLNNPGQPPLPEWRLTKFNLSNADAQLQATGNWAMVGAQAQQRAGSLVAPTAPAPTANRQRAAFSFSLDLANSGGLLTRMGMPQTIQGGKGKLSGQLSWLGSPLAPDTASMNGNVVVAIEEGQFLKAEPGVAKLLGVLSLQSLPRRLVLDFRDVFQQGFVFDRMEGDVSINAGVAQTRNLRMRGVQAVVLMEGQADLIHETQNLKVFVVPEINAGTASLAYAVINPAIGLGTFIAQVLLRKTMVEASTREFAITGTWADPKVDKVEKTSVPAAEGAASAPDAIKASQTPS
jgi:uncharacterized protein (TIGR02099 family)